MNGCWQGGSEKFGSGNYFLIRLRREDGTYEVVRESPQWSGYRVTSMVISGNGRVCAGQMVHIQMVHMVNKDIAAFFWRGGDSLWEIFSNHLYGPADI